MESRSLEGERPVTENRSHAREFLSSASHVKRRVNPRGPPRKAEYHPETDSERVPRGKSASRTGRIWTFSSPHSPRSKALFRYPTRAKLMSHQGIGHDTLSCDANGALRCDVDFGDLRICQCKRLHAGATTQFRLEWTATGNVCQRHQGSLRTLPPLTPGDNR